MVIPRPGSELKAVEEACREASRTAEPLNGWNDLNGRSARRSLVSAALRHWRAVIRIAANHVCVIAFISTVHYYCRTQRRGENYFCA
jgi:hypothetical protein